jgi:ABC-type antimicrobial peptide transport system, permease component
MLILENILLALSGLRANKMRSLLTMLGIIIGIASVIAIMTLGDSISSSVTDSMSSMGANNVTVGLQQKSTTAETLSSGMSFTFGPRMTEVQDEDLVTEEMLEDLKAYFSEEVAGYSLSESLGSGTARTGSLYAYVNALGVNKENLEDADLTLLAGRTLSERDQQEARKVVMVSDLLVNNLFDGDCQKAVGQTVDVLFGSRYRTYTIVGVYEYENSGMEFVSSAEEDTQTVLYVPLQTARDQNHNTSGYRQFIIQTAAGIQASDFCTQVEEYMNGRYYKDNDSFEISAMSMESIIKSMMEMLSTVSLAIAAIAGISLLVGGIGVMNIMLVSITERTREIGTRKALGATNGSIRLQFIMEAIVLCLLGGVTGILLGIGIASIATRLMGYAVSPSVKGIILSVSFSVFIGVFFGYYPADKAAKLNPIDALRYE